MPLDGSDSALGTFSIMFPFLEREHGSESEGILRCASWRVEYNERRPWLTSALAAHLVAPSGELYKFTFDRKDRVTRIKYLTGRG
jgi:hypothetical protein